MTLLQLLQPQVPQYQAEHHVVMELTLHNLILLLMERMLQEDLNLDVKWIQMTQHNL